MMKEGVPILMGSSSAWPSKVWKLSFTKIVSFILTVPGENGDIVLCTESSERASDERGSDATIIVLHEIATRYFMAMSW